MAKEDCEFCQLIQAKSMHILQETPKAVAMLHPHPCVAGHIIIVSKEHYPIIENVPDYLVAEMFVLANKVSSAVFESLGVQGTNLIVQNGVAAGQKIAHFCINVVPRRQGDDLNLMWQPKQVSEDEMSTAELRIKEHTKNIGSFEKEKKEPVEIKDKPAEKLKGTEKENYLIKQLRRIP